MKLNIGYFLFFFLIIPQYSYAESENQSWTEITFEKKIPYSMRLEFSQGVRLKDQFSEFNLAFFEGSISYKSSGGFKISIPYRYTLFEDKIKHRLSIGGSYQYAFKPLTIKYRVKYYRLYEEGESTSDDGLTFGDLVRSKFTFRYKIGKIFTPYVSSEIFHLFNTENSPFDEYRASLGLGLNLSGKNSISFFYTLKKERVSSSNPNEVNIIGFSYSSKI